LRHSNSRRALAIYDHLLLHLAEIGDNSSFRRFEVSALAGSSYPLRQLGRTVEARRRLDAAFERLRLVRDYPAEKVKPGSEPEAALCALADYQAGSDNVPAALETYERLLGQIEASQPKPETNLDDAADLSRIYTALAILDRRTSRHEHAAALEARRLALWQHWDAVLPNNAFVRRHLTEICNSHNCYSASRAVTGMRSTS
jgi:hypothetical protein